MLSLLWLLGVHSAQNAKVAKDAFPPLGLDSAEGLVRVKPSLNKKYSVRVPEHFQ